MELCKAWLSFIMAITATVLNILCLISEITLGKVVGTILFSMLTMIALLWCIGAWEEIKWQRTQFCGKRKN